MKKTKFLIICLLIIISASFMGCSVVDKGMVKLGFRNDDFEYINENKVDKIIIQSSRDAGFRFVVTDNSAITDIYNILSKGKIKDKKTSLDPDYIFEIHIGDDVKSYKYSVSVDERGVGNFYDDEKSYEISKNLDETIIQNLSFIRKPRDFEKVYYNTILKVLEKKESELTGSEHKVGVDITGDVDCLKYMFSIDLKKFEKNLEKTVPNAKLIQNNMDEFDTVITVKNKGYNSKVFKTTITVDDKKDKIYETYYIEANYEYKDWTITVSEPNTKPENW
ncbi:hypothetical protein ACQPU1_15980 [Clostridium paraputrificum]|uniref:hypothetical protein n=1 Tax=Clostridium TaxID=1485 RepID=UPI003D3530A1